MAAGDEQVRVHLRIEGRVQGVFFRASTVEKARQLGVTGWVMNCSNGAVEAVAEGMRARLEELVAWCRQGPPGAHVHKVHTTWQPAQHEFDGFRIKHGRW